jgi:hypothetical protein
MNKSKYLLKAANIIPDLKLAIQRPNGGTDSTGPHKVKLIEDKIVMGTDYQTGKEREEVKYIVEENGEQKQYSVPVKDKSGELHYLIQRLSEFNEGDEVILECLKKGVKSYISVRRPDEGQGEDIPIVNENEQDIDPDKIPF